MYGPSVCVYLSVCLCVHVCLCVYSVCILCMCLGIILCMYAMYVSHVWELCMVHMLYLFAWLSICQSVHPSVIPSIHPSIPICVLTMHIKLIFGIYWNKHKIDLDAASFKFRPTIIKFLNLEISTEWGCSFTYVPYDILRGIYLCCKV